MSVRGVVGRAGARSAPSIADLTGRCGRSTIPRCFPSRNHRSMPRRPRGRRDSKWSSLSPSLVRGRWPSGLLLSVRRCSCAFLACSAAVVGQTVQVHRAAGER